MQPNKLKHRQGDVSIFTIASIPAAAKDVTPKNRIVLAHGEVTGHAHAIAADEAREFTMQDAQGVVSRFLRSLGKYEAAPARVIRRVQNTLGDQLLLDTAAGETMFAANDVEDAGTVATPKAPFSRLVHEEHDAHGILAGDYRIDDLQREYTPLEIRRAAD
jgi:hypothetical protein